VIAHLRTGRVTGVEPARHLDEPDLAPESFGRRPVASQMSQLAVTAIENTAPTRTRDHMIDGRPVAMRAR
jgi:hypothetical protein